MLDPSFSQYSRGHISHKILEITFFSSSQFRSRHVKYELAITSLIIDAVLIN